MSRQQKRLVFALQIEVLELRSLLSVAAQASVPPAASSLNSLLVKFTAGVPATSQQSALASVGGTAVESVADGPTLVLLPAGTTPAAARTTLMARPDVAYAALNAPLTPDTFMGGTPGPLADAAPGNSLYVDFRADASAAAQQSALAPVGGIVVETFPGGGEQILVGQGVDPAAAVVQLRANPAVIDAATDDTFSEAAPSQTPDSTNSLLVRFVAGTSASSQQSALASVGGTAVESVTGGPTLVLLPNGTAPAAARTTLMARPDVVYAALNVPVTPDTYEGGTLGPRADLTTGNSLSVLFRPDASAEAQRAALAPLGGIVVETFPGGGEEILLGQGVDPAAAVAQLRANPAVLGAATNFIIPPLEPITPQTPDNLVLVKFRSGTRLKVRNADLAAVDGQMVETVAFGPTLVLLPAGVTVADALARLRASRGVADAESYAPDAPAAGPLRAARYAFRLNSLRVAFQPNISAATRRLALATVGGIVVQANSGGGDLILLRAGIGPARAMRWLRANPAVLDVAYRNAAGPVGTGSELMNCPIKCF